MKKIIFYVEPNWAFGSIHSELAKYLWSSGFDCKILPWNQSYTWAEMQELNDVCDLFVTTPHGWRFLGHNYKVIPAEKCAVIAHARLDIAELIHYHGVDEFARFYRYGVVSSWLHDLSGSMGVARRPDILPLGINYNSFYQTPSSQLKKVGYAGAYVGEKEFGQEDIDSYLSLPKYHKRAWLVERACHQAGLEFVVAQNYHNSYVTMPGFYKSVDAVVVASTEEGAGLPVMEAGAAGRLVISTPVGHWPQRIGAQGGHEVSMLTEEFLSQTCSILQHYKAHPGEYHNKCLSIQQHAASYDWKNVIEIWQNFLT
jgi:glycosyltransferase involved in cell wall biosynthesis